MRCPLLVFNQSDYFRLYKFTYSVTNSADQDQLASLEGKVYPGSAGPGLRLIGYEIDFFRFLDSYGTKGVKVS